MNQVRKNFAVLFLALIVLFIPGSVKADGLACTGIALPYTIKTNTNSLLSFTIQNTGTLAISRIKITRPSDDFKILSSSNSVLSLTQDTILIGAGNFNPGTIHSFSIIISTGNNQIPTVNWRVEAFSSTGQSSDCKGSFGTEIKGVATVPEIFDVRVTDIGPYSVNIQWRTNIDSSAFVVYGKTSVYGQKVDADSASKRFFSLYISYLEPETTYHYRIEAQANNIGTRTGDSTFKTIKDIPSAGGTSNPVPTKKVQTPTPSLKKPKPSGSVTPTPQKPDDVKPLIPEITLSNDFSRGYKSFPTITGTVANVVAESVLEYSIDNGANWFSIPAVQFKGSTASFSFTHEDMPDGDYSIKVRILQNGTQLAVSNTYTLTIDKFVPKIGTILYYYGAQVLTPDIDGKIYIPANFDITTVISTIGGTTALDLYSKDKTFSFAYNKSLGLWTGNISFTEEGEYELNARAVDGGRNKDEILLNKVSVLKNSSILLNSQPVEKASVAVYTVNPKNKDTMLWEGESYQQQNPQQVKTDGSFLFFLPAGKYYLKISTEKYGEFVTNIFIIDEPFVVSQEFTIHNQNATFFGRLKNRLFPATLALSFPEKKSKRPNSPLLDKPFPDFTIDTGSTLVKTSTFHGKKTVLTVLNTWVPGATQELESLRNIEDKEYYTGIIFPQESQSQVNNIKRRGNYTAYMLADPDGELLDLTQTKYSPTHFFLDENGVVKDIRYGLLSQDELVQILQ